MISTKEIFIYMFSVLTEKIQPALREVLLYYWTSKHAALERDINGVISESPLVGSLRSTGASVNPVNTVCSVINRSGLVWKAGPSLATCLTIQNCNLARFSQL